MRYLLLFLHSLLLRMLTKTSITIEEISHLQRYHLCMSINKIYTYKKFPKKCDYRLS